MAFIFPSFIIGTPNTFLFCTDWLHFQALAFPILKKYSFITVSYATNSKSGGGGYLRNISMIENCSHSKIRCKRCSSSKCCSQKYCLLIKNEVSNVDFFPKNKVSLTSGWIHCFNIRGRNVLCIIYDFCCWSKWKHMYFYTHPSNMNHNKFLTKNSLVLEISVKF